MAKTIISKSIALLACGTGIISCTTDKADNQLPNIIVIMSDDAGFSDIGCFGMATHPEVLVIIAGSFILLKIGLDKHDDIIIEC